MFLSISIYYHYRPVLLLSISLVVLKCGNAARFQVEEDDLGELADWLIAINSGKVPLGNNQPSVKSWVDTGRKKKYEDHVTMFVFL